ncbi:hypothetical protein MCM1_1509 [Methanosarcina barkeri CM1]|uniref:Uncharacterized protein n=1 Tax=Methanosarcina barkeri CM1 TaxID=796385 RepID=A0A0G3C962_METBA|nr:hypothetical protein MCM1_1509 [Methanosarcina barkeri CM1]
MKKTVLKSIFNPPKNRFGYSIEDNFDEFADKLVNDFPDKPIYLQTHQNCPII